MTFTVENSSGVKGATSYTTEAFFRAYFLDRNIDVTALTTTVVEALLIAATDYIDARWGLKFLGTRRYLSLGSRVVLTLTGQPADGEKLTVDGDVWTFRTTPTIPASEIEIGTTVSDTINNIVSTVTTDTVSDYILADSDVTALTIYFAYDGIAVTTDVSNGSIDTTPSYGDSNKQQPLEFPRSYLYDSTGQAITDIPPRLQEATCEYAYRANSAALAPDPTIDATGLRVTGSRKKIGPIETETTYAFNTSIQITKPYPAADRLLQEYIATGGVVRS